MGDCFQELIFQAFQSIAAIDQFKSLHPKQGISKPLIVGVKGQSLDFK